MYCVIQKVKNKKVNSYGAAKGIKVTETKISLNNGPVKILYGYSCTEERFERPLKYSYKISIHKSYRENGKVKKKQWVICTMDYYSIAEDWTWVGDHALGLSDKLQDIGITEDELCDMVYVKLQPIIDTIKAEFEATEEFKVSEEYRAKIKEYLRVKADFEKKYGDSTYDYCYDVFGVLRNEEYLKKLKASYESYSSYHDKSYSNYNYDNNYNFSGYSKSSESTYTEEEKEYLKAIYKAAALKLHPDIKKDNGEGMKFLNKLKEEWGV